MKTKSNKTGSGSVPRFRRDTVLESLSALRAGRRREPRSKPTGDGGFGKMIERAMETL